ncbi:MAG: carboxypeptidase regulatory-like domain-containing protein [Acidobacteria bacterium]|nr:carboxypeptidase regulatory-like domain-containing protein [Acidobacteriota bacterium]
MKRKIEPLVSVLLLALILFLVFVAITRGQTSEIVASGGQFSVEKQVVAGGGNAMSQSALDQTGTGGQTIAGVRSSGGTFYLYSGFWTPEDFAPTAALAVVGGRVLTADGRGIRNARVTVTFPNGTTRTAVSGSFGYYGIAEIPVGATYVITVMSKRFTFVQQTVVREVVDDVRDIDFIASEN